MHSRIYQIESFPVEPDYRITEDNYIGDHWFVYSVADYVANDEDRAGSLGWLKETLAPAAAFIDYFSRAIIWTLRGKPRWRLCAPSSRRVSRQTMAGTM